MHPVLHDFVAPVAVMLCDRLSIQVVVIVGGLVSCTGLAISAYSKSITGLFFGYGVVYGKPVNVILNFYYVGFGLTMVFTPALVVCTIYFEKRRATALSLSLAGAGFGAFIIPQLVVYLLSVYGYRGAMFIMSAFVLHYCVAGAIFINTPDAEKMIHHNAHNSEKELSCIEKLQNRFIVIELFRDGWFMLFITSFIFNMMGSGPVTTLIVHYSEEFLVRLH